MSSLKHGPRPFTEAALASVLLGALLLWSLPMEATCVTSYAAPAPTTRPENDEKEQGVDAGQQADELPVLARRQPAETAGREFQSVPGAPAPRQREADAGEWFMEFRYGWNDTGIKGNEDRSFLNEGINFLGEFTALHKRRVWDIRRLEGMGLFRYTDDPRIDPEVNSLQRGYLKLSGPTFETTFGDSLINYSRFSFNQNIKGLNAWKRLGVGAGQRVVGTVGVFQDRWGSIFRGFEEFADPRFPPDPAFPAKPYTRFVLGGRFEQYLDENSLVAFNYSQGTDVTQSLPAEALLRPVNNEILSGDTRIRLGRDFDFAGEFAVGFTEFDSRIQKDKETDYAARFEVSHRWQQFSWRVDYARFQPNFFSINARQVQDLQDFSARGSVDISEDVIFDASFRHTNDNLSGHPVVVVNPATNEPVVLTNAGRTRTINGMLESFSFIVDENGEQVTTTVRNPQVRVLFRRLLPKRYLDVSVGYRERRLETSNKESFRQDSTTGDLILDPNTGQPVPLFRKRVTRMPFVDLTWSLQDTVLGFSYEYRQNRDRAQPSSSTFTNRFMANYRGTYFWGDWLVSPSFRFETEPEGRRIIRTSQDVNISPLVVDFPGRDQTRSYQGSLIVDFPKYFSFDAYYRELNAELLSPFTLLDPLTGSPLNERAFGNGGYDRPHFRAALTYRFQDSQDRFVVVSFERAVNTFLNPDPMDVDTRSFRENVFQVEFVFRWKR